MTDEKIEKGLRCCKEHRCSASCPYWNDENCGKHLQEDALAYINRLKEKLEIACFNCEQAESQGRKINEMYSQCLMENNLLKDRIAELEYGGECQPLTLEQLKALPKGEWIWYVDYERPTFAGYCTIISINVSHIYLQQHGNLHGQMLEPYALYGKDWVAYKNKEQAKQELQSEKKKRGDKQ